MAQWGLEDRRARICLIPLPSIPQLRAKAREAGVYISGALFALGWWFFIDACVLSKHFDETNNEKKVSVEFVDWVPGICSALGMIIINCVDKESLRGDSFSFSNTGGISVAWAARLFLFIGFAFMAGGLAGSISVMCIKYLIPDYGDPFAYWGICNVVQNSLIMISAALLWITVNTESEYQYNFTI
ncbi:hypothetical protein BX616_009750 [Lobosporangium transversale]|uniref:Uncharacterized protein n=1 Tax=Lobosporangium transversale TaxID=64571 RepID=A0A1Y2H0B6_9FUNG|nr:hypothetical protein BCR41DRAFT_346383 [Lobosporangium transversale]KAF9913674.1 hypothetical protein BX616_009750 [Lobosporangium transversale]ORZ28000.1 hypothetical protein BCR41DRAFT_346383 [Lobosporangium transversale]|eukprot:XP_021885703.1 hypothetical protein BCR41DRAFT_346383 [Lobosporangium transversale]